jgi:hypothetical protein
MFFKTPPNSGLAVTDGTGRWAQTYSMFVAETLYPATVSILYVQPSYEILDVHIDVSAVLRDHRMFEYANQMVTQQGIAEYMDWSDGQRNRQRSDDPLFER